MTVKVAAKKKSPTKAELVRRLEKLEKELAKLKAQSRSSGGYSSRPIVVKYGLPNAPHAHLLVFKDGSKEILSDESAVNAWINDRAKKQPVEIWQMKKRTIVKT